MTVPSTFRIGLDVGAALSPGQTLSRDAFPMLAFAVQEIVSQVHEQWVAYAQGEPLPDGQVVHSRTGEYARSIMVRQLGEFRSEAYSDLAYAHAIEEGSPARDLKKILDTSPKVRVSKKGMRYLIIPFRHGTPGTATMGNQMPESVHAWWQGKKASQVTGQFMRRSGLIASDVKTRKQMMTPARRYVWGARLTGADLDGLGIGGQQKRRLEGMVNFRKPGGGAGYSAHSQFITFRVMTEESRGWQIPAQPGKHVAQQTAQQFRAVAEDAFKRAITEDMQRMLGG